MGKVLILDAKDAVGIRAFVENGGDFVKDLRWFSTTDEVLSALKQKGDAAVVLSNSADHRFFTTIRREYPTIQTILLTDRSMQDYSASLQREEEGLLDFVIAARDAVSTTTIELRATLNKLFTDDLFGLHHYLAPKTAIEKRTVLSSTGREAANRDVKAFAEAHGLGSHVAKIGFGIAEELLMNSIYDAPLASGIPLYHGLSRTQQVDLKKEHASTLCYAFDGTVFAVGVQDPFGALRREKLLHYLQKVLKRNEGEGIIDTKQGGAGLGLFKILYSSHALICNVQPGKVTEVIALIHAGVPIRDFSRQPRSICYFSKQEPST